MSTNPDHFRPRSSAGSQQYLDAAIRTASPARLRLMLIQRAIEVAEKLADTWRNQPVAGANEHSLKLLELLNELLGGVTAGSTENETQLCGKVADLYVFLVKHLIAAEEKADAGSVDEIRMVLETESMTWQTVCTAEAPAAELIPPPADPQQKSAPSGLNFTA